MENQDQNQPVVSPPNEPQMFPQPTQTVVTQAPAPQTPPKSRKKLFIIGGIALVALIVVSILVAIFYLRPEADKAAATYYKDVQAHMKSITDESTYQKRVESASKPVQLSFVFLGSTLSDDYKTAQTYIKPTYEDVLKDGKAYSENMVTYTSFSDKVLKPIQKALGTSMQKSGEILSADESEILNILLVRAELAQTYATIAEDMRKMDEFKQYDNYDDLIASLQDASNDTAGWVNTYLEWGEKINDMAKETINNALAGIEAPDQSLDTRSFTERADSYVMNYSYSMNDVVAHSTSIVEQMEKSELAKEIAEQRPALNAKSAELNKKLEEVSR